MEALIKTLPQLEIRLEKASGVIPTEQKHVSAHGYVSSDQSDAALTGAVTNNNSSNVRKESKKCQPEEGFHSESSHQLCKYLKQLQHAQLLLMCHRVMTSFKMTSFIMISLFR